MLKYQFPDAFNADFRTALITQFEPIFFEALKQKSIPAIFKLVIEEPFGDQADVYLVDPSNFGHFLTVSWEFDSTSNPTSFDKTQDQVHFDFTELPIEELQQFLSPNTDLPFATTTYQFDFECWHFHEFKDIAFWFTCKRPLSSTELNTLRFYIYDVAFEYKKEAPEQEQIGNIAEKLAAWSNQHYQLTINMGNANRKLIGKMLEAINNIDIAKSITSIQLV